MNREKFAAIISVFHVSRGLDFERKPFRKFSSDSNSNIGRNCITDYVSREGDVKIKSFYKLFKVRPFSEQFSS